MANWCEGWVKFRGKLEDLNRFIENEFDKSEPLLTCGGLQPCLEEKTTFFKSLLRTYAESDDVADANDEIFPNDKGIGIFKIKLNHAWNVDRQGYHELAKKYNLDIRGKCYENGMLFTEEFEYSRSGERIVYKVEEFKQQELWEWVCECPTLGG